MKMREIGGYIELDTYHLPMLHEGAVALNCGRNALAYLIRARKIKKLWIPGFICDSVTRVCEREGVEYSLYGIGGDLLPSSDIDLDDGEWFYFVNYYSRFDNDTISKYVERYGRIIVDQAQSYFQEPIKGVDTLYTCRKYFGVADGAFLYTDSSLSCELPVDESYDRMRFLLGRFERTASEFYGEYSANNALFASEPIKRMSRLTSNLLHALDYERLKAVREENFLCLREALDELNELSPAEQTGTFMYPLLVRNGSEIRKQLQQKKIYIPTLWPYVFENHSENDIEYRLAGDILPLPIDQRYSSADMQYIADEIKSAVKAAKQ